MKVLFGPGEVSFGAFLGEERRHRPNTRSPGRVAELRQLARLLPAALKDSSRPLPKDGERLGHRAKQMIRPPKFTRR